MLQSLLVISNIQPVNATPNKAGKIAQVFPKPYIKPAYFVEIWNEYNANPIVIIDNPSSEVFAKYVTCKL
ncbi:42708_t:CDS:2 [Gigaspora margarita]|uniref:42708_t:CDS:1 n=1 Tax=Gigaspora margarita TaxID=4874 RepID=A0ABN7UIJ2_GIGMA|nr:42708_t:CDS:2 [Gigaspora margarita]